jgi:predicted permease
MSSKYFGRMLSRLRSWCDGLVNRRQLEQRMDSELACHLELLTDDLERSGFTPEEAARRARVAFGPMLKHKEQMRASLGLRWWDDTRADLRYAIRLLHKNPGFALIAVGSLALGIGANTALFTVAQHMLLDRLSVPHPEQLRMFYWSEPQDGVVQHLWGWWDDLPDGGRVGTSFSYPVYEQLRRDNRVLSDVFAFKGLGRMTVTIHGQAEVAEAEMVSGNYYSALGVRPQLGRGIQQSDDGAVGSGPVAVISDALWEREFGHAPDVIGKTILLNGQSLIVVGINPPGFTGAYSAQGTPDIFLPFSMQPIVAPRDFDSHSSSLLTNNDMWWVLVMGRVKAGISDAASEAALNGALNGSVRSTMAVKQESQVPRLLLRDGSRGQNPATENVQKPIEVLMALSTLVLLLACANLASLLLAQAGARQREISVRLALGAPRARIFRQAMTESLLLALLGGAAGLLLAFAVRNAIPRLLSNAWAPPAFSARFSWPIFAFAAVASIATGIIFGLVPAWQLTRVQTSSSLKDNEQTVKHRRRGMTGKAIVAVQVALSMLLVVGAGLFVQTLMRLGKSPLGFHSQNLLLFSVELPDTRYPKAASIPVVQMLEERLGRVPGVKDVAISSVPLISGNAMNYTIVPQGWQRKAEGNPSVLFNEVGVRFFSTYGIRILAGRDFAERDVRNPHKLAVVNETLARKYFPGMNPVGRTFEIGLKHPDTVEIVGVCGDAKYYRIRKDVEPTFYVPYWQRENGVHDLTFAVSSALEGQALLPSLRDVVRQVDPSLPMLDVRTQDEQIAANMRQERIFATLTSGFGVLALVLACVGIYGIMACLVVERTSEIGVRLALGAVPTQVMTMILRQASWILLAGVMAGLAAALALVRVVHSMLYGVAASDPLTFSGAALLLLLVGLGASWIPARRASGIQPVEALRHE